MKFRERRRDDGIDVNITPLIDIVFLMLIFFMVSSTFIKENHLNLELPEAYSTTDEMLPETIDIVIERSGGMMINDQAIAAGRAPLLQALKSFKADSTTPITISADRATSHENVVRVLDVATELGYTNIQITTQVAE